MQVNETGNINETSTRRMFWQKKISAIEESNVQEEAPTSYPYQRNG